MPKHVKLQSKEVKKPGVNLPNLGVVQEEKVVVQNEVVVDTDNFQESGPFTAPKDK